MKSDENSNRTEDATSEKKVVSLASYRKKKETEDDLARGRRPLYVSHLDGRISGDDKPEFGDRLTRIRSSLDKINRLMSELKKISADADDKSSHRGSLDRRK
jgi:hypothetical protein